MNLTKKMEQQKSLEKDIPGKKETQRLYTQLMTYCENKINNY